MIKPDTAQADAALSLDAIGIACGTDKASSYHGYLAFYERFFEKLRHQKLRVLEIGVFQGASLRTWARYFPNASIIGADINFRAKRFEADRIQIDIIDQANIQDLVDLGAKYGPFDIIIEDGSHMWEHQSTTLKTLFPFVKSGGFYVVEDLQTNFGDMEKIFKGIATSSCVDYLKKLMDLRLADEQLDITQEEDPFLRTYGRSIEFMAFYRHCCLIEKGPRSRPLITNNPIVELSWEQHALPLGLLAHLGNVGDRENKQAPFITGMPGRQFIQGFTVIAPEELASGLSYRVRLPRGDWTDWVQGNVFAGSRGKSQDITGYSLRLAGNLKTSFELSTLGVFGPDAVQVTASDGEDCVSPDGFKPMSAMQILVKRK